MIATDKRKAIYLLHREGMEARSIARRLGVSRNTVRAIIRQEGAPAARRPQPPRINEELLRRLYRECDGWMARMHEKLVEEEGLRVSYPTLTRMLRELGISQNQKARAERVPDEPGVEMQHDTSVYKLKLGHGQARLVASLLYLRYSKRRYLKFYRSFNRFAMKCFFHEALMFWGYAARQTVIDNTNLARLRGTGAQAVIVPEMEAFAKQYGFVFRCHEINHPNRKAGEERSFWTVETNFLPGRSFRNLEDLNEQALAWSTTRMDNKPQGRAGLIPAKAFEHEQGQLVKLPAHLPAPYRILERPTDQYGYIAFDANYYWVPQTRRREVQVLEYSSRIRIHQDRKCLVEYPLPPDGTRDGQFSPPDLPPPRHCAERCRRPSLAEEKRLRAMGPAVRAYLDFVLNARGNFQRHEFIRKLLALSRRMSPELFTQSLERAHKYRITDLETVERIARLYLQQGFGELPGVEVDEAFRQRDAYLEGSQTDPPDLSRYEDPPDHESNPR